jgi:predicted membrane GTPase involved in stress response
MPCQFTPEEAMEYICDDELVEATWLSVRLRKMSGRENAIWSTWLTVDPFEG